MRRGRRTPFRPWTPQTKLTLKKINFQKWDSIVCDLIHFWELTFALKLTKPTKCGLRSSSRPSSRCPPRSHASLIIPPGFSILNTHTAPKSPACGLCSTRVRLGEAAMPLRWRTGQRAFLGPGLPGLWPQRGPGGVFDGARAADCALLGSYVPRGASGVSPSCPAGPPAAAGEAARRRGSDYLHSTYLRCWDLLLPRGTTMKFRGRRPHRPRHTGS